MSHRIGYPGFCSAKLNPKIKANSVINCISNQKAPGLANETHLEQPC